jgi:hypothetical protein
VVGDQGGDAMKALTHDAPSATNGVTRRALRPAPTSDGMS